jgi:hypothetical protein
MNVRMKGRRRIVPNQVIPTRTIVSRLTIAKVERS